MRIGLMIPANNTTMAPELRQWIPAAQIQAIRVPRGAGLLTAQTVPAYKAKALELAREFRDVDVVIYGCTAACFISGRDGDAEFAATMEKIVGKPVLTTGIAMAGVLAGADAVAIVTPYQPAVNQALKGYLSDAGVGVRTLSSFDAANVEELGRITADEVAQKARATIDGQCDALFIACSQLPTYEVVNALEGELGKPVWSSIQAAAIASCRSAASGR